MQIQSFRAAFAGGIVLISITAGCAAFQVGSDIQKGRSELLFGDPQGALAHFQRASASDPNYLFNYSLLNEGVWTYVGRAYYDIGRLTEARKALERAVSLHTEDYMARLYLGLVLAREGDRQGGLKEIEAALKGLKDWLHYIHRYQQSGQFWDPDRHLKSEIEKDLKLISSKEFSWPELIASGQWLGKEFEQEIDLAARDEYDHYRDGDGKN